MYIHVGTVNISNAWKQNPPIDPLRVGNRMCYCLLVLLTRTLYM